MLQKGELTRQRILASARRLFYLNGFTNTSVDAILRDCQIKKGNFYFHYRSKEALGYAVIESYLTEQDAEMAGVLFGAGSPIERIFTLFERAIARMMNGGCRGGCPIGNFAIEMSDIHDGFREKVQAVFDRWTTLLQGVLDEAKAAGELDPRMDTAALAATMVAAWEGAVMLAKTRRSAAVMQDCTRSLQALLAPRANWHEEGKP